MKTRMQAQVARSDVSGSNREYGRTAVIVGLAVALQEEQNRRN